MNISVKVTNSIHIDGILNALLLSNKHRIQTYQDISTMDICFKYKPDLTIMMSNDLKEVDAQIYKNNNVNVATIGKNDYGVPFVNINQSCHANFVIASREQRKTDPLIMSTFCCININPNVLTHKAVSFLDELSKHRKVLFFGPINIQKDYCFGRPGEYIYSVVQNTTAIIDCGDGFGINAALFNKPVYTIEPHSVFKNVEDVNLLDHKQLTDKEYVGICHNYAVNNTYTKNVQELLSFFGQDIDDVLVMTGEK